MHYRWKLLSCDKQTQSQSISASGDKATICTCGKIRNLQIILLLISIPSFSYIQKHLCLSCVQNSCLSQLTPKCFTSQWPLLAPSDEDGSVVFLSLKLLLILKQMAAKQTIDPDLSSEKWFIGSGCSQHLQEDSDKQFTASDVFPATDAFPNLPSFQQSMAQFSVVAPAIMLKTLMPCWGHWLMNLLWQLKESLLQTLPSVPMPKVSVSIEMSPEGSTLNII